MFKRLKDYVVDKPESVMVVAVIVIAILCIARVVG